MESSASTPSKPEPTATYQPIYWFDGTIQRRTVTIDLVCSAGDNVQLLASPGTPRSMSRVGHCRAEATKAGSRKSSPMVRVYEVCYLDAQRWFHEALVAPQSPHAAAAVIPTSPRNAASLPLSGASTPTPPSPTACALDDPLPAPPAKRARHSAASAWQQQQQHRQNADVVGREQVEGAARIGLILGRGEHKAALTLVIHAHDVFPGEHLSVVALLARCESPAEALRAVEGRLTGQPLLARVVRAGYAYGRLVSAWRERRCQDVAAALAALLAEASARTAYGEALRAFASSWEKMFFGHDDAAIDSLGSMLLSSSSF
eukprot:m51a1_g777 hypothetical protein (317) ;mRNA; f:598042-599237